MDGKIESPTGVRRGRQNITKTDHNRQIGGSMTALSSLAPSVAFDEKRLIPQRGFPQSRRANSRLNKYSSVNLGAKSSLGLIKQSSKSIRASSQLRKEPQLASHSHVDEEVFNGFKERLKENLLLEQRRRGVKKDAVSQYIQKSKEMNVFCETQPSQIED